MALPSQPTLAATAIPRPTPALAPPYTGPLFDTHFHVSRDVFQSGDALLAYLEKDQVLWAIGFYKIPPERNAPLFLRAEPVIRGAQARVIPLGDPLRDQFVGGQYTEALFRSYLQPQGLLQGIGEIHSTELGQITFESAQMQAVFRAVNEMKGIVMVHPSGFPLGRRMDVAELEPPIRQYSNITFLFHGNLEPVLPLLSKHPNVYFTYDTYLMTSGPWSPRDLMCCPGSGSAQQFVADVNRVGFERIVEDALREALPVIQRHPDRILWGTDRATSQPWHYQDSATELILRISREFIGRLPAELQENYAFRNALRIFGRFLPSVP